ncbi:MAG: bifunctional DNA-formamidopyrimidine glycosylase/DNA-(apurinic or apyrimidinic site) lyase [Solobacterium sp.]|nr:bifunctional DNA-formamidopyrimidine glycosylase/DNA-(apurinic or apyrimidinic site) lyase [Solobacterium sp.]
MPELPEVETVVRTLERMISGRTIIHAEVRYPKMIEMDPEAFVRKMEGQTFRIFSRRGKYLLFGMDDCILCVHLRMEGKFFVSEPELPRNRHMHVIFDLDDGRQLRYQDTRKFGRMEILEKNIDLCAFHGLGPEPFQDAFTPKYIHDWRKRHSTALKTMMLDQSFVAGVGNIYADEILFACRLRPGRSCKRITKADEEAIVRHTRRILNEAIRAGGTTIRSYTSSLGVTGLFQNDCFVHEKKICRVCGSEIRMKRIGRRSSYYCPVCQK